MKKKCALFVILFILTGAYSFAADADKTTLGIQGTGGNEEQVTFFVDAFSAEAAASGYEVTTKFDFRYADYGIKFEIVPNTSVVEDRFFLNISLVRIKDLYVIASATYSFSELEDMVPYTQYLFYKLTANIPGRGGAESTAWRNKWLYLRVSFDYPITVYELKPDGLFVGPALYRGDIDDPDDFMPLDNRISALPGGTIGLEMQLLNWLSLEVNASLAMEEFFGDYYYTATAAAELKFPIKIKNFMIEPYGMFTYPIPNFTPSVFSEFPQYGYGGGIQVNVKGGPFGAFFVDVNYLYMPNRAFLYNPYLNFPNPEIIQWRRYVLGLGVGYKLGLINKK
jgi:hypothetical protein